MSQSQKEAAEYAEVLLAYSRGEPVQMRLADTGKWREPTYPLWDFARYEYRVAPKPVERWHWLFHTGCLSCNSFGSERELLSAFQSGDGRPILMREVTE